MRSPAKNFYKLSCHFERRSLKLKSSAWCRCKHETEVNVNQMAFFCKKYVCIVTVFYLEYVANQTVSCQTIGKVLLRLYE